MVLKNNNLQKLEKAADRRQHFGIRKLTIGAASVLLGTTLWLGRDAINVEAADQANDSKNSNDADQATESKVETPKIDDKTQVEVQAQPSAGQIKTPSEGTISASSSQTDASIKADAGTQENIEQKQNNTTNAANEKTESPKNAQLTPSQRANAALNKAAAINQKTANAKQAGKFVADTATQEVEHAVSGNSQNDSHVQKVDFNKLDLSQGASYAGLSIDSNLGAQKFLANLLATKQNISNKDAVVQSSTSDSKNVNSTGDSSSLISGADSALDSGKNANNSETKQVVVEKEKQDKATDTLSQGDAALKKTAAIINAGTEAGYQSFTLGKQSFVTPNELKAMLAKSDEDGQLQPNTMEGGKGYQYTTKDGITFADDPAYPNPYNNIPKNQYAFWECYFGTDTSHPVVLTTDRTPGENTNAGKNIYYYYKNIAGKKLDSSTNFGMYTFVPIKDPKTGFISTVLYSGASGAPDVFVDYGSGHNNDDKGKATDITTNKQREFGIFTYSSTDISVEYVDENGDPIKTDANGDSVSTIQEYGMDHQYYDATQAVNRPIAGYTPTGTVKEGSAPIKDILDARKQGFTYITGDVSAGVYTMLVHTVKNDHGDEDISMYQSDDDTNWHLIQTQEVDAENGEQSKTFTNGATSVTESLTIPVAHPKYKIIAVYKKNPETKQNAQINFVDDDNNGSSLHDSISATGNSGDAITFANAASVVSDLAGTNTNDPSQTTKDETKNYIFAGVTADTTADAITKSGYTFSGVTFPKYDNDENTTQTFTVHFKHNITESTISKKVNLNVTYKNEDGSDANVTAPANATNQTLTFTGTAKKDVITGNYLNADGSQGNATTPVYTWTVSGGTTDRQNKGTFASVTTPTKEGYTVKSVMEGSTSVDDGSGNVKPISVAKPSSSDPDEQTVNVVVTYQKKSAPVVGNYKEITVTRTLVRNIDYKINSNKATDYDPSGLTDMDLNKLSTPHTETQTVTLEGVGVIDTTTGQLVAFDHTFDSNGNVVITHGSKGDAFVVEKDSSGKAKQGQFYWRLPNSSKFAGFDNPTADGFTSETGYDENGKMSPVTEPNKVPEVDVTKDTQVNVYDSKGNLVSTPTVGDLLNQWNKDTVSEPIDSIKVDSKYPDTNGIVPTNQYIFDQFQLTDDKENLLDTIVTLAVDPTDSTGKVYVYFTNSNYTQTWYKHIAWPNGGSVYYGTTDNDLYEKYNNGNYVLDNHGNKIINPNHHIISVYNFGGDSGNSVSVSVDNYNYYNLKRIFGYGTQFTGDDNYSSSWGDYKPSSVSQTISFIDQDTGKSIPGYATIKNNGVTGESYDFSNFKAPEIPGYELVSQPEKTGSLSDFKVGQTYTRTWMTVTGVKITEAHKILNDSGEVQTYVWVNGQLYSETPFDILKNGYLKGEGNQTPDVTVQDSDGDQTTYVIQNPYVPQTTDLKYVYKKVNTSLKENPVFVVYTPGNTVASMTVKYEDEDDNDRVLQADPISGSIGNSINYSTDQSIQNFEKQGYVLDQDNYPFKATDKFTDANNGQTYTVLLKHRAIQVTPNTPSSDLPNNTPDDAQPQNLKVTVTRNISYKLDNGSGNPATMSDMTGIPNTAVKQQTVTFTGTTFVDAVTGHKVHAVTGKDSQGKDIYVVDNSDTTPVKISWSADNNGKFASVVAPNVAGYTHSPQTIAEERVVRPSESYTEPTIYVVYTPNAVQDTVKYIDDTTNKTLRTDSGSTFDTLKGQPNDAVTYTTSGIIQDYENQGYILASTQPKPFTDGQMKFGTAGQTYEVHFIHKIDNIDKDNPHGQTVTKTVTRKVYYTVDGVPATDTNLQDQTETATFDATGYYDEVAKQVVDLETGTTADQGKVQLNSDGSIKEGTLTWAAEGGTTDSANLAGYDAPTKTGYHVNNITVDPAADKADNVIDAGQTNAGQVKGINVNHNSHDVTIYINLTKDPVANPQAAKITVIDEDNYTANNQLASAQISGKAGSAISFGNMSNTIQNYIKNGYVWDYANEGTTKLSATNYAGINFGKFDSDDNTTQNWTIYLRHGTTHVDHDQPGNGYSADDLQKTVTTKISYVDEKGNEISGLDPVSHTVTFNGQGDYDNVTKQWVKVDTNNKIIGPAPGLTWTYVVDNQASQNGDSTTLSAIDAKSPSGYTYAYTSGSWDSKLGVNTTDGSVEQQTVTPSTADSNIIVHFNKIPTAQANIVIIYHDDTTNTDLKTDTEKPQDVGSNITYSTQPSIDDYEKQGYKLVSNVRIPSTMPTTGFTGIVHLAHDTFSQPVKETAKAHVHYVISGNPTEPAAPADSDTQTITWSKTDTVDKVTDKVTKEGKWTSDKSSFSDVTSPTVTGYTPSQASVSFATPVRGEDQVVTVVYTKNPVEVTYHTEDDTKEVTRTINYLDSEDHSKSVATPVTQTAQLSRKKILDNKGNVIGYGTVSVDGKSYTLSDDYTVTSNGWIAVDSPDETAKGYKKIPHLDDGSNASTVSAGTVNSSTPTPTTINVYYDHDTVVVPPDKPGNGITESDLNKIVTRTIKYQDNNGAAVNGSPDGKSSYVQIAHFTRTAIVDKTNNKLLGYDTDGDGKVDVLPAAGDYAWMATNNTNQFASVASKDPSDVGYNHVDIQNVSAITVGPNSGSSTVTVTYSKDAQQGSFQIHYIDEDDNNAVLHSDSKSGKYGDPVSYDPSTETNALTDQGYVEDTTYNKADKYLAQTSINENNNGKIYIIAFKHGIKQGPTETIVPTETIHFRYADGTTAAPDVQGSAGNFKFTRTPTLDAVTGHVIDPGTWNKQNYTFNDGSKNVKVISGYVADKATYGNKTATPTDKDVEDVVIYRKISNIIPVDQNGNQIPGTTPVNYTNDPNDPTKVTPNETSPNVPNGWKISTTGQPDGVIPDTTNNTATVTPADPTKPTKVVYIEDSEKATLHIIDINDGNKELNQVQASGKDNSGITFNNAQTTIDEWLTKGYKVNSIEQATTDPKKPISYANDYAKASSTWTFDDKPGVDQEFYVYLEHDYAPINPENPHGRTDLTRQVKETVHYVDEATNRPVVSDYTNTLTFTGQGMVDKVTHKMLAVKSVVNGQITYDNDLSKEIDISKAKDTDFVWSNPSSFAKVISPTIAGYTIDADKTDQNSLAANGNIQEIDNVGYDHSNVKATVYYKANPVHTQEAATLTIIDDTTGSQLADYSVTGQDGAAITFKDNQGNSANSQISDYLRHDYDWEKSSASGLTSISYNTFDYGKLDNDPNTNQTWTIYLIHKTKQLTHNDKYGNESLDKKITRTVTYQYDDGTTAANQVNQTVEFNGQGYIDQVTGQLVQDDGHGHVKKNADGSIAPGQITWELVKQGGQAVTDGTDEATFTRIGKPTVDQNSSIVKITSTGDVTYSVNNDGSVEAQNLTHQNNDSNVVIVYHKGTVAEHHTAELTIYANDKQVGTAIATGDKGTDISFANADSIVQAFEDNGFTFDHAEDVSNNKPITGTNYNDIKFGKYLAANNSDQKFAIYLTKASVENSDLKIVDDTENRTLANYGQSGQTGDAIKFADGVAQLKYYLDNGYNWSKADKNGATLTDLTKDNYSNYNFGKYQDNENPVWTIHLVHQIVPVDHNHPGNGYGSDQLTKTITTKVSYVDQDGNAIEGLSPINNTVTFNGFGYYDAVTKQWTDKDGKVLTDQSKGITWANTSSTPNGDSVIFNKINAQHPAGYTYAGVTGNADPNLKINQKEGSIDAQTVTPTSADSNLVVHFNKNAAKQGSVNVIFHDTTTGQDIYGYGPKNSLVGDEGTNVSGYTTDQDISTLESKGYEEDTTAPIPSGDLTKMPSTYTDGVQIVYINMKHKIDTIKGDNPYGVKATATVTRNINYHFEDGTTLASHNLKNITQTVDFTGSGNWDEVLKKVVDFANGKETVNADGSVPDGSLTWTPEQGQWNAVEAINVPGYAITHISVNSQNNFTVDQNTGAVSQATVDHNSNNATVDIYLNKVDQLADLQFVDEDNNNQQLALTSANGKVGEPITFVNGENIFTILHGEGYDWDAAKNNGAKDYASYDFGHYDDKNNNTQHFTICLKHHINHVDHDHPGNGYGADQLQKTVTTRVSYVDQNDNPITGLDPVNHTVTFNGSGYYDAVTKQWTDRDGKILTDQSKGITWIYSENGGTAQNGDTATFAKIDAQHPAGYTYADITVNADPDLTVNKQDGSIAAQTVTPNSANSTVVIRFNKNITKQGTIEIIYHDNTSNVDLTGYGQTTTKQDEGTDFTYNPNTKDLPALEKLHYVVDGQLPTIPAKYTDGDQRIVIYVKHGTENESVSKKVTRDFIYVFSDGTRTTAHTTTDGQPVSEAAQLVTFKGHKIIDLVTGKTVSVDKDGNIGTLWDKASLELPYVSAKEVKGYHVVSTLNANVDGSVGEVTVTPNSNDIHVRIIYAPDEHNAKTVVGKQTVHYVDGDDNNAKLLDDNVNSTFTFTKDGKTGQWNAESHQYDDANAPVISGYVAEQKTYTGQTATPTDPNKEITIIYHKISKIIPVDKSGNQIPNQPTPTYVNDPKDPTKVVSNQPTPNIPGWHITNNPNPGKTPDGKTDNHTVTPVDPAKPTKVTYEQNGTTLKNKKTVTASQKVEYQDDKGNTLSPTKTQNFTFTYSGDTCDAYTGDLIKKGTWDFASHNFGSENVPNITGYTLTSGYSKNGNSYTAGGFATDPNASDKDRNRTFIVVYTKTAPTHTTQTATLTIHDATADTDLGHAMVQGPDDSKINFGQTPAEQISYFLAHGYKWQSATYNGADLKVDGIDKISFGTFDKNDDSKGASQAWVINLVHQINHVDHKNPGNGYSSNQLTKTITTKVSYVDQDGNPISGINPIHNTVTFNGSGYYDAVTKQWIDKDGKVLTDQSKGITWTNNSSAPNGDSATFAKIDAQKPEGYTYAGFTGTKDPKLVINDQDGSIDAQIVTPTSADSDIVIHFRQNQKPVVKNQNAGLRIIDQDNNNTVLNTYNGAGKATDSINFNGYSSEVINNYIKQGYIVVGLTNDNNSAIDAAMNGTDPTKWNFGKYDDKDDITQNFTITLKHGTEDITPNNPDPDRGYTKDSLTRTGTQTVHYIIAGSEADKPAAPADHLANITFTHSLTIDKVTGKVIKDNGWTPNSGTYTKVDTPIINGYEADKKNIPAKTVTIDQKTGKGDLDDYEVVVYTKTPKAPDEASGTVIYIDDTAKKTLTTDNLNGQVGSQIDYTTAGKIADYEKQGYKLVSNNFRDGQEVFAQTGNNFAVHLIHTFIPINPKTTDKHGVDPDTLEKTVTETVHYEGAGKQTPNDNVQTSKWSKQVTYDEVTGKVVTNGQYDTDWAIEPGQKTVYDQVNTPNVPGYQPDQNNVPAAEVTQNNITKTVTYSKNPAAQAHIVITYHDDTTNIDLKTDTEPNQDVGTNITYSTHPSISNFEKQGYKLVSDVTIPTTMPQDGFTGVVHLAHTYSPIDHDHSHDGIETNQYQKDVTATVHYVYSDDTKAHDDNVQKATWTRALTIDNVTGQIVPNGKDDKPWTANKKSYDAVSSPAIAGYHPDKITVPAKTVTQDNLEETVIYVKNGTTLKKQQTVTASQTVEYQDDQGHSLSPTKTQNFTFTYTGDTYDANTDKLISKGKWTAENHSFTAEVVPVIDGYVAVSGFVKNRDSYNAGGFATDHDASDAQRNKTFVVIYKKISSIVPITPDHKPIPNPDKPGSNVPSKPYINDPKDPTKVVNESVPTIPGYMPNTPTVTPADPTKPTEVTYTKNPVTETGTVTITVHDNTTGKDLSQYGYSSDKDGKPQKVGTKVDYNKQQTITDLINHGYKVVNPDVSIPTSVTEGNNPVVIYVEHTTTTVTPDKPGTPGQPIDLNNPNGPKYPTGTDLDQLKKTGTQTIHYTDAGKQTPADNTQSFTFTRQITFDNVTGKIINTTPWNVSSHTFDSVTTPVVNGYHADKGMINGSTVTPDDLTKTVTVAYNANGHIIPVDPNGNPIPGADQPVLPTDPKDPTKVVNGQVPAVPGYQPVNGKPGDPVAPDATNPGLNVKVPYQQNNQPSEPDVPINPSVPQQPTNAPTQPPTAPTAPTKPIPDEPDEPAGPDTPDEPDHPATSHRVHRSTGGKTPRPQGYSYNNMPHGEYSNGYNYNNRPLGQTLPNGDTVLPNGEVVDANGNVVGYIDESGHIHYNESNKSVLPQTGESSSENIAAAIAGGLAVSIGLIGLAGVKKKRRD